MTGQRSNVLDEREEKTSRSDQYSLPKHCTPRRRQQGSRALFCALQGVGEPIETLVEACPVGRTRGLDVPVAVAHAVQAQFLSDVGRIHGVGQVLREKGGRENVQC